jgi:SAM-dependent methyltransferase
MSNNAMAEKQVESEHYHFSSYMHKGRFVSLWHQLDEVQKLAPNSVLEIGVGPGFFKTLAAVIGLPVETLDIDPALKPDHVGSVTALPFDNDAYDLVCAFQMLEHMPYDQSLLAFAEMARVSRRHVVLSLPDARRVWQYSIHIPRLGPKRFFLPRPRLKAPVHEFDGEHYWEIGKKEHPLPRVIADLSQHMCLVKSYRVFENPFHRFFVFEH